MKELSGNLASLWDTARELEEAMEPAGLEAVEGRRFLLRMLAACVDSFVENNDVDRPVFEHAESPSKKMFADCPDADYLSAPIATGSGRVYRLSGRIPPGTVYVGFLLYGRGGRIGNHMTERDLVLDDEGRFEILVSKEEQSGPWLAADGDETLVMVRQYFTDRAAQAPIDLSIEFLGEARPPAPLEPDGLARQVGSAERMLRAVFERTLFAHRMASSAGTNAILQIPEDRLFPTPDNTYRVARFSLKEARRLVLSGTLPEARYFSVTLYNAWLESYDYLRHRISLNHEQIEIGEDGSFAITIADEKATGPNTLDTAGHDEGYLVIRVLLLSGDMPTFTLTAS